MGLSTSAAQDCAQGFSDSPPANFAGTIVDYFSAHHHSGDLHADLSESRGPVYRRITSYLVLFIRDYFVDAFLRMLYGDGFHLYTEWNLVRESLFSPPDHTAFDRAGEFYTLRDSVLHFHFDSPGD